LEVNMKQTKNRFMKNVALAIATICTVQFSFTGMASAQTLNPGTAVAYGAVAKAYSEGLQTDIATIDLTLGDTSTIKLTYNGKSLDNAKVDWSTTSSSIASVKNGVVTGKGTGLAYITASYADDEIYIIVNVEKEESLKADTSVVSLKKGNTKTITLKYNNKTLSGSSATWTTSNTAIATVKNGVVTAKSSGTAVITAKYNGQSVKVTVNVDKNVSGMLGASESAVTMKKGDKETITLTYDGAKLAGSKATWKTNKTAVATVTDGVITAKGEGTATIKAEYKGEKVEIEVKVDEKNSKKLEAGETKLKLKKGKKETVKLKYDGKSVSGSKATWKTSKSSVATVDDDGVITAKAKGTATITASYKSESVKIEVQVDTTGSSSDLLEASKSKLSLDKGDKATIKLTYDGSSLSGDKASWSTSKSSVATVSSSGVVTAKAKGTATITAKYKKEEVEIEINVETSGSSSDSLEAEETSISLKKGSKETIGLMYNNSSLSNSKASWTTSKSSVATVSDRGVVTGKAKGTATITAEYKGEKVKIKVTVK